VPLEAPELVAPEVPLLPKPLELPVLVEHAITAVEVVAKKVAARAIDRGVKRMLPTLAGFTDDARRKCGVRGIRATSTQCGRGRICNVHKVPLLAVPTSHRQWIWV
jgi:hypothetical protein